MCSVGRFTRVVCGFSSGIARLCRFISGIILLTRRPGCSCTGEDWESNVCGWGGWGKWSAWGNWWV